MVRTDEVIAIAQLARLELTAAELAALPDELSAVLGHMEALAAVDTSGVEPMIYGTAPRDTAGSQHDVAATPAHVATTPVDLESRCLTAAAAVGGAAQVRAMQFVVPNVLPGSS